MIGRRLLVSLGVLVAPAMLLLPSIALLAPSAAAAVVATTVHASPLPPSDRTDLVAIFDPKVRRFGLRVTRASLVNANEQRSKSGTHLAIYVEPTGRYTPQDYIDGAVDVTRVFLPYVFTRWKGLRSFDVCQEPPPAVDDRLSPAPETQVFATRAGSKRIDWPTVDVADLIRRSNSEVAAAGSARDAAFSLYVAPHLQNTPAYQHSVGVAPVVPTAPPTTARLRLSREAAAYGDHGGDDRRDRRVVGHRRRARPDAGANGARPSGSSRGAPTGCRKCWTRAGCTRPIRARGPSTSATSTPPRTLVHQAAARVGSGRLPGEQRGHPGPHPGAAPHPRRRRARDGRELPRAGPDVARAPPRLARATAAAASSTCRASAVASRSPQEAAYCASKFALCGWTEAMAVDLYGTGVEVKLVLPGPIDTEIWDQPGNDPADYQGPFVPAADAAAVDRRRHRRRRLRVLRPTELPRRRPPTRHRRRQVERSGRVRRRHGIIEVAMNTDDRLYFRQLLSGRDFARDDPLARQMVNFVYLVGDRETGEAVVIDPAYGVGELVELLDADGLRLTGVLGDALPRRPLRRRHHGLLRSKACASCSRSTTAACPCTCSAPKPSG